MCSLVTAGQAGPEVAGIINPVAIAAVSVHLPLRDLRQSSVMPFASRSRASCSPGRHVGHPSPLSSTPFCSPLIRVNYNRGQHIFQDTLLSSWRFKSAGPAPCPPTQSFREGQSHPLDVHCPSTSSDWKQSMSTFLGGRMKKQPTSSTINTGYCIFLVLCHILGAWSEGKLHLNILNRSSCQLWVLPLLLRCKQIASRVTSVWIRLARPCHEQASNICHCKCETTCLRL